MGLRLKGEQPCCYIATVYYLNCFLKDATVGLLVSKLFATCWGMLFQVFRPAYLCLGWVHLGFVSSTVVRNKLLNYFNPWSPFPWCCWLVKVNWLK